ncbi:hypothetical protein DP939_25185 [Spongiactinospora rosea]|uniref:Uncharacterized protein n=1 Tax=Spongiactinospora rosea TaxID=2248750 RepID=A0A366LVA2_9ACTN|nr:hypothetical protein DP939_25185 [Spongiactinospora rosea]
MAAPQGATAAQIARTAAVAATTARKSLIDLERQGRARRTRPDTTGTRTADTWFPVIPNPSADASAEGETSIDDGDPAPADAGIGPQETDLAPSVPACDGPPKAAGPGEPQDRTTDAPGDVPKAGTTVAAGARPETPAHEATENADAQRAAGAVPTAQQDADVASSSGEPAVLTPDATPNSDSEDHDIGQVSPVAEADAAQEAADPAPTAPGEAEAAPKETTATMEGTADELAEADQELRRFAELVARASEAVTAARGTIEDGEAGLTDLVEQIYTDAARIRRAVKSALANKAAQARGRAVSRPGTLRTKIATHLAAHPDAEFTPYELGKALGHSSGAVTVALDRLVALGQAAQVCDRPRRFAHHTS